VKRGFKSEAERLAVATRKQIGLDDRARLDLDSLRAQLGVEICSLSDLDGCSEAVAHLHGAGQADFSAALVLLPADGRLVVVNDSHTKERLRNSVAHELSHLLLDHTATPGFDPLGNREWRADDEDEANWLAGCLLAPRDGLIAVMNGVRMDLTRAAGHYEISIELMRQRWHQTGCAKQVQRAAKRRR
jgi:hypothetical protein